MLSRLFAKRPERRTSRTPAGCVVWAIGDIHGRAELADRLIQAIRSDLSACTATRRVVVLLGDYVDRGPNSRAVLDQLCNLTADPGIEVHGLRGNHEAQLDAFLADPTAGPAWCDYGGRDTLASYGIDAPAMRTDAEGWARCSHALAAALPASHRSFLSGLAPSVAIGDYFFCHAGARPGVPLARQDPQDLMWIRGAFLDHAGRFEQVVVHGHSPTETVVSDDRRIGLDTGAYATGILSAVRLEGEARILLQTQGHASDIRLETVGL